MFDVIVPINFIVRKWFEFQISKILYIFDWDQNHFWFIGHHWFEGFNVLSECKANSISQKLVYSNLEKMWWLICLAQSNGIRPQTIIYLVQIIFPMQVSESDSTCGDQGSHDYSSFFQMDTAKCDPKLLSEIKKSSGMEIS